MEDKVCTTCKHYTTNLFCGPCSSCCIREDGTFSGWEPAMTQEEFKTEMEELATSDRLDEEERHRAMDHLMCEVLRSLGYGDGIDIFDNTAKWYA